MPDDVLLKEIKKEKADEGVSNGVELVRRALAWCDNEENHFDKNKDRVVVSFDLDCLSENDIKLLIDLKTPFLLYGFSNPKFEVVQLLSLIDDLSSLEEKYNTAFPFHPSAFSLSA